MDKFIINGGTPLKGKVNISGAKNAAVAIISAVALSDGVCRLENIPQITDVTLMLKIMRDIGAKINMIDMHTVEIDPRTIKSCVASYDLARQIRGSYYFMGALLGKYGHSVVPLPGGCYLGVRPIDQHLKGFTALGATYTLDGGMVSVKADKPLIGANIYLDMVTVGATMNIMLAATKAVGMTVIENAAKEPHIVDLANFLNTMGADIRGAGTDVIKIRGVKELKGVTYSIIPDQIEAGTYMAAAAITRGDVTVYNVIPKHLESITAKLEEIGLEITEYDEAVRVRYVGKLNKCNVKTMPHPGFPTDMQPQIAAVLSVANGTSIVNENVWDNRYRYVEELRRMGAQFSVDGKIAVIEGVDHLEGAPVRATDLRAGAALVIAALAAHNTSEIEDIHYIERGYECIVEKIRCLGGNITKIHEDVQSIKIG